MLHVRSIKKAVIIAFYSPAECIGFWHRFAAEIPATDIIRRVEPSRQLELFTEDSIPIKN
jgi:hypothetical protein